MVFKSINTYQRLGVPAQVINTILVLILAVLIAPYVGGIDFGVVKVPDLSLELKTLFKWLAPLLFVVFLLLFIPLWKGDTNNVKATDKEQPDSVQSKSKYRLQSTPDIILNELQRRNVNTGGIKIVPGFNIHDLKKRIKILNSELSSERITAIVESARDVAFTSKYAEPREDEKLENVSDLKVEGIKEWQFYLQYFLSKLGVPEVRNIEVLDVGIGNAYASQVFHNNCANLTGVDISQSALNYAKDKLPNATLQIGSAENLKEIDSFSIDLYISLRTYQSTLFDMKDSIHEAYRVLSKGGGIVISIPIMFLKKDDAGKVINVLKGLIPQGSSAPSLEYAMHISEKIEEYMILLGFNDVEIYTDSPFEIYIGSRK